MRYWGVLPAAGTGRRFGGALPKQYAPLAGLTVLEWSLHPLLSDARCRGVALALSAEDRWFDALDLRARYGERLITATGGAERCESVLAGLAALPAAPDDWVLVHDAARPCLTAAERDALLDAVCNHAAGGLLALPLADTLKQADALQQVSATLPRQALWRAQTPQMFRHGLLVNALQQALARGERPTDEAQAIEALGCKPLLVEGRSTNLKVTSAADLPLAQALLTAAMERA